MTPITCEMPIFYATTEGQTGRIAERLAVRLREEGFDSRAFDVARKDAAGIDWAQVRGAVVGASLHVQRHQEEASAFVLAHVNHLNAVPTAFVSVSLSSASTHPEEVAAARRLAEEFPAGHGWQPARIVCLAGRLAYTRYNVFIRWVMKRVARKQGAPTDTSRDYEFTNWDKVDALARDLANLVRERGVTAA
jgi:menaquinone-dependent protoporphyrinogen oxidase